MADQEVIKHTKKIYKIWSDKERSFWHKVKEFALEVFIIVFAVTLSIWLHSWSEHNHQQKEVKQFLLGLRSDLESDIAEMKKDKKFFTQQQLAFSYVSQLKQPMSIDSFDAYQRPILNLASFNPNNGRFEGFKYSGKIATIENEALQNDIMDFYQEDIISLLKSTLFYNDVKKQLLNYLFANVQHGFTDSTSDVPALLVQTLPRNLGFVLGTNFDTANLYDTCINKANKIIAAIDKQYGPRPAAEAAH